MKITDYCIYKIYTLSFSYSLYNLLYLKTILFSIFKDTSVWVYILFV